MKHFPKILFYIVIVAITFNYTSCKRQTPLIPLSCVGDCFEIRGVVWNASTNKPEVERKIYVKEDVGSGLLRYKEHGFVYTNVNGEFFVKIRKGDLADSANLPIILELQGLAGYLNSEQLLNYKGQTYYINEINNAFINVYDEAVLEVNIKNTTSDTIQLYELNNKVSTNYKNTHSIYTKLAPNAIRKAVIFTASNVESKLKVSYIRPGMQGMQSTADSLLAQKDQNNTLQIDIK